MPSLEDFILGATADRGSYNPARTDASYDPMSDSAVLPPEPPVDPRAFTSEWARVSGVYPGPFEPQGTQWPQYPPPEPKAAPPEDRPNPLIPFSAYRSLPPKHRVGDIAAQQIVEQGPGATGIGLATGAGLKMLGASPLARSTIGGTVASAEPTEAEAAVRDPRLWSRISGVMLRKPLDEMEHQYTNVIKRAPKFVNPEELLGNTGIFTPWDMSRTGGAVTHIDGNALARAVALHGGPGFPQANPGLAAASEAAISRRLDNQAAEVTERTGKPPLIIPITMSGSGVDASHHVADPLSQLVQTAPILRDDLTAFNDMMRARVAAMEEGKKNPALRKTWMNTDDPNFQDYIANMQGGMKIKAMMADRMALREWQNKGFPDVAAVRHAVSEPNLIELPSDTAGMTISRYVPGQGLIDTSHPSYSKGVAGQHMGQTATLAPLDVWGPSITEAIAQRNIENKAAGKKSVITPAHHFGKPSEDIPTEQYFDDQWLENFMKHVKSVEDR